MTGQEILQKELEKIRQELIQKHLQLGMKASGAWVESVEVQTSGSDKGASGKILANHYTKQLVEGRPPTSTTSPSSPTLKEVIEQWIIDKGITPIEQNMKISSLAFLIARKIHREGTQYFKDGGIDLVDAVITSARLQEIINKVTEFHVSRVVSEVKGYFYELQAA